ncbi:type II toxin-antitoxin system death-on-curing family toxin [Arthrobacter pigmenti]
MIYLTLPELIHIAERTLQGNVDIRDHGLLEAALARPRASAFGADAYSGLEEKAAALLHSLARNHALHDGNKRLALAATLAFLGMNGFRLALSNDEAYDFVVAVSVGRMNDVATISDVLRDAIEPR